MDLITETAINRALKVVCQTQFAVLDVFRQAQAETLGAFGYNPSECTYKEIASGAYWRLRDYGGRDTSPPLLIVAAPIKRPYIWDIAPSASAIRYCLEQGFRVYLVEWKPASSLTGSNGVDEHVKAILEGVKKISDENRGSRAFLIGHSLGGTLAAISCASASEAVRGLVMLSAPLCFELGASQFRDNVVSMVSSSILDVESFPGSLLSYVTVMASPHEFTWSRLEDAALSVIDSRAMELHSRVERWTLDEVAVSGKLFRQMIDWLCRENRLCRGTLSVAERQVGPSNLSAPVLAVVNPDDEVAPLASMKPFIDALPTKDARIILCPSEVGVCLQHVGILTGRHARNRIWPEVVSWLHLHS